MPLILNGVPQLPEDPAAAVEALKQVVEELYQALNTVSTRLFSVHYAAPSKPRTGDLVFADGTSWNPGSGQGWYSYYGGTWNKL